VLTGVLEGGRVLTVPPVFEVVDEPGLDATVLEPVFEVELDEAAATVCPLPDEWEDDPPLQPAPRTRRARDGTRTTRP
jgi:hypothetical protein